MSATENGQPPVEELRPARRTRTLGLPIPGDVGSADYVTATGTLADAIDALAALGAIGWSPGDIKPTAAQAASEGWLLCDGRAYSRTVFAALFRAIGVAYGAGDGQSTFNVPNLAQRVPVGAADPGQLGQAGGAAEHTLSHGEMPHHNHSGAVWDPTHAHAVADYGHAHYLHHANAFQNPSNVRPAVTDAPAIFTGTGTAGTSGNPAPRVHPGYYWWDGFGWHNHAVEGSGANVAIHGAHTGVQVYAEGGGAAHNNMPPFQVIQFLIKT